jgi:hypothetical protein
MAGAPHDFEAGISLHANLQWITDNTWLIDKALCRDYTVSRRFFAVPAPIAPTTSCSPPHFEWGWEGMEFSEIVRESWWMYSGGLTFPYCSIFQKPSDG